MLLKITVEDKQSKNFMRTMESMRPLMKELSLMALSAIQKNIENGIKPDNAPLTALVKQGKQTLHDMGTLRSSLNARSTETEAVVATNVRYAHIHNPEDGRTQTVIRPKSSKYLCLPASSYTRTLLRRYDWSPREVIEGLRAKEYAVYRPYKKGSRTRANVIMAKKKRKEPFALFILKTSVTIPARPFMFLSDDVIKAMSARAEAYYEA